MDSDIWFLFGLSLFSTFSLMFLLIAMNANEWWHKIVFLTISLLTSWVAALFWMVTLISVSTVFMLFYVFVGFIDFLLIIFLAVQAYNLKYPSRNKRYRPEIE